LTCSKVCIEPFWFDFREANLIEELRNAIYNIVQEDILSSWQYRNSTLLLRRPDTRCGRVPTPISYNSVSLAHSCRAVRDEFLPLLIKPTERVRITYDGAESYFCDILLRIGKSILVPDRKVWTLRIWTQCLLPVHGLVRSILFPC
jgi:hypothetical protein